MMTKQCSNPVDTGRRLNVHKTFRRRPTFNLRPVYWESKLTKNVIRYFMKNISKYEYYS